MRPEPGGRRRVVRAWGGVSWICSSYFSPEHMWLPDFCFGMAFAMALIPADEQVPRSSRKRPAAAMAAESQTHASSGVIERPQLSQLTRCLPVGPISYASDCSGLDAGAVALKSLVAFRHAWASEVNPHYRDILQATHPDVARLFHDVSQRSEEALEPHVGDITVYTAGFPCVSFSKAGAQQGHHDPSTGMLSFYVVMTVCTVLPDMFILENVPEFASDPKQRQHFDITIRMLCNAGCHSYNIYWRVLNSKDYSVPAQRKRIFIVGLRRDRTHGRWVWPPAEPPVGLETVFDTHQPTPTQQDTMIAALPPSCLENLARGLEQVAGRSGHWVIDIGASKSRRSQPTYNEMPTITKTRAGKRHWYISDHGLISESELLRCQGFEPSRVTVPAHTNREKVCEMAGNAMTVTVMRCLLRNGLRALGRM